MTYQNVKLPSSTNFSLLKANLFVIYCNSGINSSCVNHFEHLIKKLKKQKQLIINLFNF